MFTEVVVLARGVDPSAYAGVFGVEGDCATIRCLDLVESCHRLRKSLIAGLTPARIAFVSFEKHA